MHASVVVGSVHWESTRKLYPSRAVREGRVADTDPGHGAVDVLEDQLAHLGWGIARSTPDHGVDGIVAQPSKEARFPIVECPRGKAPSRIPLSWQ